MHPMASRPSLPDLDGVRRASRRPRTDRSTRAVLAGALAGVLLVGGLRAPPARGGPEAPTPRGPSDVYERGRASLRDILVLVAGDLKLRADAWPRAFAPGAPRASLVLVVDPTTSMQPELLRVRAAIGDVAAAGPEGMAVGVVGVATESCPPGRLHEVRNLLTLLSALPLDGPKNLLEAVREATGHFAPSVTEPRAVVLITREGGDGEDDVERTRAALEAKGAAFYAVAPEAAFERPWVYDFVSRDVPELGLTQRMNPAPKSRRKGELFYGADVAYPLVPYRWEPAELPFAQTEFAWPGISGRFPPPSGFGYWCLATLCFSTGGRCFVHNFRAPGARSREQDRSLSLYDLGFLNLFAPDLRPRDRVLASLNKMKRVHVLVRIWEHLADDAAPVVTDRGTLERPGGGALSPRPMLPVRSARTLATTLRSTDEVAVARATAAERRQRVEVALGWWVEENKRATTGDEPRTDPLRERVDADFALLGVQLLKARFHWGEAVGALDALPRDVFAGGRTVVLVPEPLAAGRVELRPTYRLPDVVRASAYVDAMAAVRALAQRYPSTPWAVMVDRGHVFTLTHRVIEPPPPRPPRPPTAGRPTTPAPAAPVPPQPAGPPPPPERPGSGSGGPTTGN